MDLCELQASLVYKENCQDRLQSYTEKPWIGRGNVLIQAVLVPRALSGQLCVSEESEVALQGRVTQCRAWGTISRLCKAWISTQCPVSSPRPPYLCLSSEAGSGLVPSLVPGPRGFHKPSILGPRAGPGGGSGGLGVVAWTSALGPQVPVVPDHCLCSALHFP